MTGPEAQYETDTALAWPASSPDGIARREALALFQAGPRTPTSLVSYRARDSLLLVVDEQSRAEPLVAALADAALRVSILVMDNGRERVALSALGGCELIRGRVAHFEGYLGEFLVRAGDGEQVINLARALGHERDNFDLILDLAAEPLSTAAVPPPGYFAPRDQAAVDEALERLPEMVGEFDKPKYFHYDPSICAHASSQITGCTRCLDACPTTAIQSLAEQVEVDPFLCQGGGVCATACPTGAITYQFPPVSDLLENLRGALKRYQAEQGSRPWLLILDDTEGRRIAAPVADRIPENIIPVMVEEAGSVGMDAWLAALCYGAHGISIACPPAFPHQVRDELKHQTAVANTLLGGLGLPDDRIRLLDIVPDREWWRELSVASAPVVSPAGFAAVEEKRATLHLALDHLYENAPKSPRRVALPAGSPFGEIEVDRDKCTLCMACVSVCPASALHDGEDLPMLQFIENNCVQCGICESACPEDAISLRPGYTYDSAQRMGKRTLNEEKPFLCVRCNKPFTTEKMMQRIRDKLTGHWMYQDPAQRKRLEMCEECRVQDLFAREGGLDPYHKPSSSAGRDT